MPVQTVVKLYISNFPYSWGKDELERLFSPFGTVTEARVIKDRDTGEPKGFGFVSLDTFPHPIDAWRKLQGTEVPNGDRDPRKLTIDVAKPKAER